ncbi:hypothetical protein HPB50_025792 [Hyalomma asiaticum]|uniref:Uncharacterized protein n=1 Tax=Hyalomma asiaticum TaxID=266040 RepID=A0ACB7ST72_HYAAI|nr:hypothetical protein HPB50_025792 [Hyalomma asiaticum]
MRLRKFVEAYDSHTAAKMSGDASTVEVEHHNALNAQKVGRASRCCNALKRASSVQVTSVAGTTHREHSKEEQRHRGGQPWQQVKRHSPSATGPPTCHVVQSSAPLCVRVASFRNRKAAW